MKNEEFYIKRSALHFVAQKLLASFKTTFNCSISGIDFILYLASSSLIMFLLSACSWQPSGVAFHTLSESRWEREDTLVIDCRVAHAGTYEVALEVRNEVDYPYRNLSVELSRFLLADSAGSVHTDTLFLELADERGRWRGKGLSSLYLTAFPAGTFQTDSAATFRWRVVQRMNDAVLLGIQAIGIHLSEHPSPSSVDAQEDEQ